MKAHLKIMNKKPIILASIVILAVIAGIITLSVVLRFHKITVSDPHNVSVSLYNSADKDKKTFATITSNTTLSLKDGNYCSVPSSTTYDTAPACFTVQGKAMSVTINPSYSEARLAALLPSEMTATKSVITTAYAAIISQYTLGAGKLYGQGQWYGTTLAQNVSPSDRPDIYRVLLQKSSGTWKIVAYPQISLSKYDYPQIPVDILRDLNKQTPDSEDENAFIGTSQYDFSPDNRGDE